MAGTTSGKVYIYQIEDTITELHNKKITDVPLTCIKIIDEEEHDVIIGSEDGYIYIYSVYPNLIRNTIKIASQPIMNIIYRIEKSYLLGQEIVRFCIVHTISKDQSNVVK